MSHSVQKSLRSYTVLMDLPNTFLRNDGVVLKTKSRIITEDGRIGYLV